MSFWDDFAQGLKDVGTSVTRIVTDTAIDIGDVATGFQFTDDMQAAKKTMSDAGVLSAADAIEKNHYPFLKTMERDAESKLAQVQSLFAQGQAEERKTTALMATLSDMCLDVSLLFQESLEARELLAEAKKIPNWKKWVTVLDIPAISLDEIDKVSEASQKWETVGRSIQTSGLVVGAADGIAVLVALAALSKGSKLAKLGQVGTSAGLKTGAKASQVLVKSSKFIKVGKMAGKASGVLAVVTVGIDIGLSVVELEAKKSALEKTLSELNSGIAEAQKDLADLKRDNEGISGSIQSLLRSVSPPQTQGSWQSWVEATRASLRLGIVRLLSVSETIRRAEQKAEQTRGKPLDLRISYVAAIDPAISLEEARQIIDRIDRAAGKADPLSAEQSVLKEVSALPWKVTGPGQTLIHKTDGLDRLTLTYGFAETPEDATWTYYTTAPRTISLPMTWRYGAIHSPASLVGRVVAFADSPAGRQFTTLYAAAPQAMNDPAQGSGAIQVYAGQAFGVVITAKAYDSAGIKALCGAYTRSPVENNWHVGTIDIQDEIGVELQWTNRAGVSWDLLPHLKAGVLLKMAGSPYQDAYEGSNEFTLLKENDQITGFRFIGEVYALDPSSQDSVPTSSSQGITLGSLVLEFSP